MLRMVCVGEARELPRRLGIAPGLRRWPFSLQLDAPVFELLVRLEPSHDLERPCLDLTRVHRDDDIGRRSVPSSQCDQLLVPRNTLRSILRAREPRQRVYPLPDQLVPGRGPGCAKAI